ncbi:helix-turn-helix transcriptional regulator [Robinsoniella peoriensis]|uniref:helix-turn-helix transcriptional regulator n=1 Tax=Robinsoniella peoriensis TaxID=180332 RepID=UPI00085BED41|nr:helix-turn-helix domain-containing protein [Robinsoniella peoriensis]
MNQVVKLSLPAEDKESQVSYLFQTSVAETFPLHSHDFYEIFYVTSGKAIHNINGLNQVVQQGSLYFIRPSDIHSFSFINDYDIQLISCGIEPWIVEECCQYMGISLDFFADPEFPMFININDSHQWTFVKNLAQLPKKKAGKERKTYFLSFLPYLLYELYTSDLVEEKVLPSWFAKLLNDMAVPENFVSGLEQMILLSGVSQEHLNRTFRNYLDMTPTEYLNTKRINYAASLLLKQHYEIIEICYMAGFNNLSYFYKAFHKEFHCTPKQFTKKRLASKSV